MALSICSLSIFAQTEKEIKAPISHVTVFPDRAQLTHETQVTLASGQTLLKLVGLSPYIDIQSISVKGTGNFTIISVSKQNDYLLSLEDQPEMKELRRQQKEIREKVENEKAAISVIEEKESFLEANRAILANNGSFSMEQFKSVMEMYMTNIQQVKTDIVKKTRQLKIYEEQQAAIDKQIEAQTGKKLPSGCINVLLSAERNVTGKLDFSYVVSRAGWFPSYDIRVEDITKPVVINYKANVFQSTGVAWDNVKISFSNATPWVSGNLPSLSPWFIDYFAPMKVSRSMPYMMAKSTMAANAAVEEEAVMMDMEAGSVAVEKSVGETTVNFDVSIPYSIASDGKTQIIELQKNTSKATYRYATVPKLSSIAYLTGDITDWSDYNFQNGDATLYFENSYVGTSTIRADQSSDTLTLSLGPDNSIVVSREKQKEYSTKKTIGANQTDTYSYVIMVRNNKSNDISIRVYDQIPLSTDSGISVEPTELSKGKLDATTGEVTWDLTMKPQETKKLILTYSVKYPKEKTIIFE